MKIFFRVDSSFSMGTGHVMRCLTLAEQLRKKNFQIEFICRNLEGNIIPLINQEGYKTHILNGDDIKDEETRWYKDHWLLDAEECLKIIGDQLIELLIVDHYGLDYLWESTLIRKTNKLMVIDDLANRRHYCDLLLDQNFYFNMTNRYNDLVPKECKLLLGPQFALLRNEFMEKKRRKRTGEIKSILIFFGGTDPTNETEKTIHALTKLDKDINVNVIIGQSNIRKTSIEKLCNMYSNFKFYCQVTNISDFMNEADLAIGAGGSTTWERCYLGLPSIIIIVADNQVELARSVSQFGAIINLGFSYEVTSDHIFNTVSELISNPMKVRKLSEAASSLVNPDIVHQYPVVQAILEELT